MYITANYLQVETSKKLISYVQHQKMSPMSPKKKDVATFTKLHRMVKILKRKFCVIQQ